LRLLTLTLYVKNMKGIIANILWYVVILFGLGFAALNRRSDPIWEAIVDVRMNYDILYGALGIILVLCITGLILKKRWGYHIAVSANATLTLLPGAIFVVSLITLIHDITLFEIIRINVSNIIVCVVSLVFWLWLVKSDINFEQKNI